MLANRLLREPIEPARFRVSFDLPIPLIVKIHLGQTLEKLGLVSLRQLLNGFDDFTHRAHKGKLAETFPMTSLREIELRLGKEAAFATFSLWRAKGRRERMKDKELRTVECGMRREKTKKNGRRKN